jgi:hypothetical protein
MIGFTPVGIAWVTLLVQLCLFGNQFRRSLLDGVLPFFGQRRYEIIQPNRHNVIIIRRLRIIPGKIRTPKCPAAKASDEA